MAAKGTFAAGMKDGSTITVDGYLVAPGLAVHRILLADGTIGTDWNITHVPSGWRVCGSFTTRRDAMMAAEQFALLADWSVEDGVEVLRGALGDVLAIRNRILFDTFNAARDRRKAKDTGNLLANPKDIQEDFFA